MTEQLSNMVQSNAMPIIEWAPFKLKEGISESTLIQQSDLLQEEFLAKQKGFIRRELLRGDNNMWVDVIYWSTIHDAKKAMEVAPTISAVLEYFNLMDTSDDSNEMSFHYQQVKTFS